MTDRTPRYTWPPAMPPLPGSVRRLARSACVLVALLGGSCVSRRPVEPPLTVPSGFSAAGSEALPPAWWKSLGDDQLNELIDRALSGSFQLQTAWDRLAQAEAIAVREGAELIPAVDADAGAARTGQRLQGRTTHRTDLSLGVTARYELDLWGRIRSGREAARLDAEARAEDIMTAAITLSAWVAQTWYELAEMHEQLRVLAEQIEANRQVLALITAQFRKGQARAADVLRQRQLLESTQGGLIIIHARREVLEHQLAALVGLAPDSPLPYGEASFITVPPLPATGIPAELIGHRPDVRSAYLAVQAADLRVSEAIADRFPRLTILGAASTSGEKVRDLFDNWLATIAAELVQPVIDGGRRRAEVSRARAVTSQAIHEYGQAIIDALQDVEDALAQERRQAEYLVSLEQQLATARQVIDRTRDNYLNGQLDYLRVLEALATRQALERSYVTAKRQHIGYRIDLCRALACGWTMERPALASADSEEPANDRPVTAVETNEAQTQ